MKIITILLVLSTVLSFSLFIDLNNALHGSFAVSPNQNKTTTDVTEQKTKLNNFVYVIEDEFIQKFDGNGIFVSPLGNSTGHRINIINPESVETS